MVRVLRFSASYSYVFFSSRRRHTRYIVDWSSDVCSSDLGSPDAGRPPSADDRRPMAARRLQAEDRKSVVEGKRVDLGGRRILKKKTQDYSVNVWRQLTVVYVANLECGVIYVC